MKYPTDVNSHCKHYVRRFEAKRGEAMADQENNGLVKNSGRRLFLEKAGRFAAITPPAVALMLSATGKARAATGSGTTTKTTVTETE
jgi:hypothetical protein